MGMWQTQTNDEKENGSLLVKKTLNQDLDHEWNPDPMPLSEIHRNVSEKPEIEVKLQVEARPKEILIAGKQREVPLNKESDEKDNKSPMIVDDTYINRDLVKGIEK